MIDDSHMLEDQPLLRPHLENMIHKWVIGGKKIIFSYNNSAIKYNTAQHLKTPNVFPSFIQREDAEEVELEQPKLEHSLKILRKISLEKKLPVTKNIVEILSRGKGHNLTDMSKVFTYNFLCHEIDLGLEITSVKRLNPNRYWEFYNHANSTSNNENLKKINNYVNNYWSHGMKLSPDEFQENRHLQIRMLSFFITELLSPSSSTSRNRFLSQVEEDSIVRVPFHYLQQEVYNNPYFKDLATELLDVIIEAWNDEKKDK
jgi:hypothetical protein